MTESNIKVLIVDDSLEQGENLAELLERKERMVVEVAKSGEEAISRI